MPLDGKALGEQIVTHVREYVAREISAMSVRMAALEQMVKDIPAGPQGEAGRDGIDGKDGAPGLNGKDGAPGSDGERGPQGEAGISGKDGIDGKDGAPGERGEKGLDGLHGKDGRDGRDGKDGESGRDAAQLDPLPAIDEAKSYPRGTWASHKGGLWKALSQTDGMHGWVNMVDGIDDAVLESKDGRNFKAMIALASGKGFETDFYVPTMIYRGIWKEGEYERGDCVTWGGSMFHCDAEKTTAKPETSTDWKLCAKRGRDGKDAEPVKGSAPPVRLK
jgi:hypothetical protein